MQLTERSTGGTVFLHMCFGVEQHAAGEKHHNVEEHDPNLNWRRLVGVVDSREWNLQGSHESDLDCVDTIGSGCE